uniref:Uncharacterized protein n=1 Tax=Candidatus Kentrum sp. SD TaxID=2126332 RepID=A0A451BJQ7_9GAMM|nr:MAG: hypothetical protein BECKSD772D_GA0070982_10174 [Candidatus Kentron sp. SD]
MPPALAGRKAEHKSERFAFGYVLLFIFFKIQNQSLFPPGSCPRVGVHLTPEILFFRYIKATDKLDGSKHIDFILAFPVR